MSDPGTLEIAAVLRELGFDSPATLATARQALEDAKLTRPGKTGISGDKRPAFEALLRERFHVTCGTPACRAQGDGRTSIVAVDRAHCWVCAGSPNRAAAGGAGVAFEAAGIRKVVVVGGSPKLHDDLRAKAPAAWELRLIEGTARRTLDAARGDVKWADLVLIWGATELDHKVSGLYFADRELAKGKVIIVQKRGLAALLDEAATFAKRRAAKG